MQKLKKRWGIATNFGLAVVFLVFAITGSASAWLSKHLCFWIGITKENAGVWFTPIRLLLIFPIYQIILVAIGFLFGQFEFFWNFEKKLLRAMRLGFLIPNNKNEKKSC